MNEQMLQKLNNQMLGLGAPSERDEIGYNRPDFMMGSRLQGCVSQSASVAIANILMHYKNTQMADFADEIKEYLDSHTGVVWADRVENVKDKWCIHLDFQFKNSDNIRSCIKSVKGYLYTPSNYSWYVPCPSVLELIEKFEKHGIDTTQIKEFYATIPEEYKTPEPLLKVIDYASHRIAVATAYYDENIINIIKDGSSKARWNPTLRAWEIPETTFEDRLDALTKAGYETDNLREWWEVNRPSELLTEKEEKERQMKVLQQMHFDNVSAVQLRIPENTVFKPYEHQKIAAKSLFYMKKFLLADEMGAGKTLSSIWAAYNTEGKKLIVCPSCVKINWKKELKIFGIPEEDIVVIQTAKDEPKIGSVGWTIINYDKLKYLVSVVKEERYSRTKKKTYEVSSRLDDVTTVIFDEAHYCKTVNAYGNPGSDRAAFAIEISKVMEFVFLLTGTPMPNHTCDLYNLLKMMGIAGKSEFGTNWMGFSKFFCGGRTERFGYVYDKSTNVATLNERLSMYMLRRRTEDLVQLPGIISSYIPCDVNLKTYQKLVKEALSQYKNCSNAQALTMFTAMRKTIAESKIQSTIDFAKDVVDKGEQVVIFTNYTKVLNDIANAFNEKEPGTVVTVSGTGDKDKAIDAFQSGQAKVIVCNIQAGSVGINLFSANVLIFNDYAWLPAEMEQAKARIYRIGQKRKCSVFYMYASGCGIDEDLTERLNKKMDAIGRTIDGETDSLMSDEEASQQDYFRAYLHSIDPNAED